MRNCDETAQLDYDCNGHQDDDLDYDDSPLDVPLNTMRSVDGINYMICLTQFFQYSTIMV